MQLTILKPVSLLREGNHVKIESCNGVAVALGHWNYIYTSVSYFVVFKYVNTDLSVSSS